MINEQNTAMSGSTVSWSFTDVSRSMMGKFCEKIDLIQIFETTIRSHIVIILGDFTIDFASETNGEMVTN